MHENVRSLIISFVLILNILLSSQWTIYSDGVQWGYNEGTVGVQWGYSGGTGGVQWGYSGGTVGYRSGTVGVQEKSIKRHNTGILFHIYCNIIYNATNEHGMICFTCSTFYDTNFFF